MSGRHVFISYARKDADFAQKLRRRLQESRLTTWRDIDELRAGEHWQQAIDEALQSAAALVVVMSPHATESQYVTYEWAFALGAGIRVVPVLKKAMRLHPRLASIQFVDFTKRGKPWLRLLDVLHERPRGGKAVPKPEIRAEFSLVRGKPEKVESEYVVLLSIEKAPRDAVKVAYEIHDESFDETKWSEKNPEEDFATWMQSYGDILLSAVIRTPTEKTRIEVTLYEALQRTHGRSKNRTIQRALRDIELN
jgi:hypothetical protein